MKALLVSSKYPPEYSGSGLRAHNTHLRLREKYGVETEVICSSTEFLSSLNYTEDGLKVSRVLSSVLRKAHAINRKGFMGRITQTAIFRSEMNRVTQLLQKKSFDVMHVFGYSPATMAAIQWSRIHKIPLMRELVNVVQSPYQYPPRHSDDENFKFSDQSVVVAISSELGNVCRNAGLSKNVWVRPNPVDLERFHYASKSEKLDARSRLTPFSEKDTVLVFISKFRGSKNHSFLLDVLNLLPENYKLLLAGPPSDPADPVPGLTTIQIESLVSHAESNGMHGRIFVKVGFVNAAEYMRAGDIFCIPAEKEALGTPLLEALVTGLPVVANRDESNFREWITEGQNGSLRSLSASCWAEAILKTTTFSDSDRRSMSDEIKTAVSSQLIDEQYYMLLSELCQTPAGKTISVSDVLS